MATSLRGAHSPADPSHSPTPPVPSAPTAPTPPSSPEHPHCCPLPKPSLTNPPVPVPRPGQRPPPWAAPRCVPRGYPGTPAGGCLYPGGAPPPSPLSPSASGSVSPTLLLLPFPRQSQSGGRSIPRCRHLRQHLRPRREPAAAALGLAGRTGHPAGNYPPAAERGGRDSGERAGGDLEPGCWGGRRGRDPGGGCRQTPEGQRRPLAARGVGPAPRTAAVPSARHLGLLRRCRRHAGCWARVAGGFPGGEREGTCAERGWAGPRGCPLVYKDFCSADADAAALICVSF